MFGCQLVSINEKPKLFQVTESFADKIKDSGITCSFRGNIQVRGLSGANTGYREVSGAIYRRGGYQGQTQVREVSGANAGYREGGFRVKLQVRGFLGQKKR